MDDSTDSPGDNDWLRNLPLRSEELGFSPEQMSACEKCGKRNAPNRTACLYCGAAIEGAIVERQIENRPLEIWEDGFNVIVAETKAADIDQCAANLASLLGAEPPILAGILASGKRMPIARVETEDDARFLSTSLASMQIASEIVSDAALLPTIQPVRLRAALFDDDRITLTLFNTGEQVVLTSQELALVVRGALFEGRTESIEKRKRRSTTTISETQTSSDLPVIDIYSKADSTGWRISAHGFDFSCLGAQKSMIAGQNMDELVTRLSQFSPTAKVITDFTENRAMLEHCWPSESRRDAHGFQRSGFARKDLASVSSTNNSVQLIKYSRLQWHLL